MLVLFYFIDDKYIFKILSHNIKIVYLCTSLSCMSLGNVNAIFTTSFLNYTIYVEKLYYLCLYTFIFHHFKVFAYLKKQLNVLFPLKKIIFKLCMNKQ